MILEFNGATSQDETAVMNQMFSLFCGLVLTGLLLTSCVTPDPTYLKNRRAIEKAKQNELAEKLRTSLEDYSGPCQVNSDCRAIVLAGACCGCPAAVHTKQPPGKIHTKLDPLCEELNKDVEDQECNCGDVDAICVEGRCALDAF
jgi:hypothetical protein